MDDSSQRPNNGSIQDAARHLMTLLNAHLQTPSEQQVAQTPQQPASAQARVQLEMSRSFPGLFSKASARGKKRFHSPCKVMSFSGKAVTFQFYLLNKSTDRTPTASTELTLVLAGMGRRTVTLPESADHFEISRLLTCQFPKLESSSGGWLLYKALGGSGQRCSQVIFCKSKSSLKSLGADASEFQKMPKAACMVCRSSMPLQVLAVHVKSCVDQKSSEEDRESSPDVAFVAEDHQVPSTSMRPNLAVCPVCQEEYPLDYLEIHASSCGESLEETPTIVEDVCKSPKGGIRNLNDVIQAIADGVSTDGKTFDITVSRQNLFERGLVQWQRQKKTPPTNPLKVTFLGEAGIDTGALRKEFLTTMVAGIERRFFVKGSSGCTPKYSLSDLDKGHFKTAGEIMATSLAQGGPAPNFMMRWCHKFLCTGSLDFETLDEDDVGDDQYTDLLSKVKSATETTILDLTEEILNCGHTGSVCLEKKEEIIRSVVLHANLRLIPILQQIRDGMGLYSLCHIMAKYPDICQPLFVPGIEMKADADFIISVCQAEFSERGSNKQLVEVTLMNHLQDFLQELEQDETESGKEKAASLSPTGFLQWVTGQGHIPILQEDKKSFRVNVKFSHHCQSQFGDHKICYPSVAACTNTITFPVQHMRSYEDFKNVVMEAFLLGQEFSRV